MNENFDEQDINMPSIEALEDELTRERIRRSHSKVLRTIVLIILAVIVAVILVTVLVFPIYEITGSSMARTLNNGDVVVALKTNTFNKGDVVAYEFNNSIQIKRIIARSGDTVDIDQSGNVFVNGALIEEPYLETKSLGESDIDFPYQVPDGENFVLGDHRETSIDSRNTTMGCIKDTDIESRILFRIWPIANIGAIQ